MATHTQVQVIDADAHVVETERTWDYLEPSEQRYRPLLYTSPDDPVSQYWVIDNQVRGLRFPTLAEQTVRDMSRRSGREMTTPQEARELDDVALRLQHLDELGIDVHSVRRASYAALEHIVGLQFTPDLFNALVGVLVSHRGRPGNHP